MSAQRRRHRRDAKRRLLKHARSLYLERRALERKLLDAELVPLERPYQRGWVRYFKWSDEACRRKDFDSMNGVLEVLQNKQWSRHPDFRQSRWKHRARQGGWAPRLAFHPKPLLKHCREAGWLRYFSINGYQPLRGAAHLRHLISTGWNGKLRFNHPQLLEPQVEPHYVTHLRVHDPAIDARIAEIDDWIEQHGGWHFVWRAMGWRNWNGGDGRNKKLRLVDQKEVMEELEGRGIIRAFRFVWRVLKARGVWPCMNMDAPFSRHLSVRPARA